MNPLTSVRTSCFNVVNSQSLCHVAITQDAISTYAKELTSQFRAADAVAEPNVFSSLVDGGAVEWDSGGIHYCADVSSRGPKTVQFIFVMDAMNFCFWPSEGFEYDTLAVSLKNVLESDPNALDADKLASVTSETVHSWFPKKCPIPNLSERVDRLQELGSVLDKEFGGLAANLVAAAKGSAVSLVRLILMYFPGFRDTVVHEGRLIHFYKRAQILVADIWGAYGRPKDHNHPYCFNDMKELTMFADYRVPQILRHVGILKYSDRLAAMIDSFTEIPFGSPEETEIRACTVVAVEMLQKELSAQGLFLLSVELDWLLWQRGEDMKDDIAPHHRTLTIYY